jgi:hypothetical protein
VLRRDKLASVTLAATYCPHRSRWLEQTLSSVGGTANPAKSDSGPFGTTGGNWLLFASVVLDLLC